MLEVSEELLDQIRRHAEATYPEECCGFLVARESPRTPEGTRRLVRVAPMANRMEAARGRRFVIPPEELRRFEASLDETGEILVGFYHSHPDHPAVPSLFDQEHAWPWYSYLIVSVDHGRSNGVGVFELDAEARRFRPVPWAADTQGIVAR